MAKKNPTSFEVGFIKKDAGIELLSHRASSAIPSPLAGLTSVFGMGTGVTPPLLTPAKP